MQPLVLTALIFSSVICSVADRIDHCGCIDRSWQNKEELEQYLDHPYSKLLCTAEPISDQEGLDRTIANTPTQCKNARLSTSAKSTPNGFPDKMVSVVQEDLTDGKEHIMLIVGNGDNNDGLRLIFKSKKNEKDVPFFMKTRLKGKYILIHEKKDGEWCRNVVQTKNGDYTGDWRMYFIIKTTNGNQQINIHLPGGRLYRFYPQTHIKKGDWFISKRKGSSIRGIYWASDANSIRFKTGLVTGLRIVIRGKFGKEFETFRIDLENKNSEAKVTLMGTLTYRAAREDNSIMGYETVKKCSKVGFLAHSTAAIVLEITKRGIKYYGNGQLLCTFESEKFKPRDISVIHASGLKFFGVLANTCDYYILSQ